jgi:hypothetical protein
VPHVVLSGGCRMLISVGEQVTVVSWRTLVNRPLGSVKDVCWYEKLRNVGG